MAFECRPETWPLAILPFVSLSWLLCSPRSCETVAPCQEISHAFPKQYDAYAAAMLAAVLMHELAGLVRLRKGTQDAMRLLPELRSKLIPSLLLSAVFTILLALHGWYANATDVFAHAMPPNSDGLSAAWRPVYTATFVEWLLVVPLLLTLAGHCALGRPMQELAGPVIVTDIYIVMCWAALLTSSGYLRWSLIVLSLGMYVWVSYAMMQWVGAYKRTAPAELPARTIRPLLTEGLILLFFVYGIVFLSATSGYISANAERLCIAILTNGAKLAMSVAFVMIRAEEYHETLTLALKHVSNANMGMLSILRASFDIIMPSELAANGSCMLPLASTPDMRKLESTLGRSIGGVALVDLIAGSEGKANFNAYIMRMLQQESSQQAVSILPTETQVLPPLAQVVHCHLQLGTSNGTVDGSGAEEKGESDRLGATLHLSVIPECAVFSRSKKSLVIAVRLDDTEWIGRDIEAGDIEADSKGIPEGKDVFGEKGCGSTTGSEYSHFVGDLGDLALMGIQFDASAGVSESDSQSSCMRAGVEDDIIDSSQSTMSGFSRSASNACGYRRNAKLQGLSK